MNLTEFAKKLNLSLSTVSKALSDSHEISIATKIKVLAKAKEFNYQANPMASSLRKHRTNTIAVIIPEVVNGFFGQVINGIESVIQENGYHLLIYLTHDDMQNEVAVTRLLQNGRVDGILISLSQHTSDISHLQVLKDKGIPLVFFDRIAEHMDVPKVITDDYNSGIKATQHLINNGCKRIAFLSISKKLSISNKRLNGYLAALKLNNLKKDNSLIIFCDAEHSKNIEMIRELLKRKNRPDCVFASVENLAIATYAICDELHLKIPNDIKVITFSNSDTSNWLNPPLTAITQPAYEMGRRAGNIVLEMIGKTNYVYSQEIIILNSTLVERVSTKNNC